MKLNRHSNRGFTLIEVLLAITLFVLLGTLVSSLIGNTRRTAAYGIGEANRIRRTIMLREIIQTELDTSVSPVVLDVSNKKARGFSFETYGKYGEKYLLLKVRYSFEARVLAPGGVPGVSSNVADSSTLEPEYDLVRYFIPEGFGTEEKEEILVEGLSEPSIRSFSSGTGEFLDAEETTEATNYIRIEFASPNGKGESFILKNGYAEREDA